MMKEDLFNFICLEFRGVQRNRALNILYNKEMSKSELKLFYSNWIIKSKFELRKLLIKYSLLYQQYKVLNKRNNNILEISNSIVISKELELEMLNLSNCISIIGINVLQILKNIEKLSLFKAIDIATIFSIPLELVNEGIEKYKDNMFGIVFNLIVTEVGENKHIQKNVEDIENICLFPLYWSKNIAYFNIGKE